MDNIDIAKEWFHVANSDLASAEFLQNMQPVPVEIICYHCQQAAEKYLKGYLAWQGEAIKKTHDLTLLNKLCRKYDEDFGKINEDCLMLTDFGVNVRYPFPIDIGEADMVLAIKRTQKIRTFVLAKTIRTQ